MSKKYYSGIGSRETPAEVLNQMRVIAHIAAEQHYVLRSGGANGADLAFEQGCDIAGGESEIYLPWKKFNQNPSPLYSVSFKALELAKYIHPCFDRMKQPAQLLMGRNMYQVLGLNLDTPVEFVVCYTSDGCEHYSNYQPGKTGGTGAAIALASRLDIPVYNLRNPQTYDIVINLLEGKT